MNDLTPAAHRLRTKHSAGADGMPSSLVLTVPWQGQRVVQILQMRK